ncbi:MAG: ATP synthase F0 subunit B [Acidobacteria bacterium]|nr:ATP synthase F0 subunit B [Acidobacteriota bacterium]
MIPDLSVLWVIALLMLCVFVLNTLIFKPILHVIESRTGAVRDARELAASASQKAAQATEQFDRTLGSARAEVYKQMDDARRTALDKRAAIMADTKREADDALSDATSRLTSQASAARAALESEATNLAGEIVNRVLGRTA